MKYIILFFLFTAACSGSDSDSTTGETDSFNNPDASSLGSNNPNDPNPDSTTPNNSDNPTIPDNPTPDNPTPDNPTPDNPTPDNPTPNNPTPDNPNPNNIPNTPIIESQTANDVPVLSLKAPTCSNEATPTGRSVRALANFSKSPAWENVGPLTLCLSSDDNRECSDGTWNGHLDPMPCDGAAITTYACDFSFDITTDWLLERTATSGLSIYLSSGESDIYAIHMSPFNGTCQSWTFQTEGDPNNRILFMF